jgi:hypothetical protein
MQLEVQLDEPRPTPLGRTRTAAARADKFTPAWIVYLLGAVAMVLILTIGIGAVVIKQHDLDQRHKAQVEAVEKALRKP